MAGKTDMDRVGLFQEMKYHTIGDPFKGGAGTTRFNVAAGKGKQMLTTVTKSKTAHADGYFENFQRVFDGEAYSDPIKQRRLHRLEESKKKVAKEFVPSSYPKKMCGVGSHLGTFSGNISSFSAVSRSSGAYKPPGKNVMTNPGKQGTGYGYIGVTIGKYPDYKGDKYDRYRDEMKKDLEYHKNKTAGKSSFKLNMHPQDYFDSNPWRNEKGTRDGYRELPKVERVSPPFRPSNPGKKPGGCKAGTLEPFPSYSSNPYERKRSKPTEKNSSGKVFMPNSGPKSAPCHSIVGVNAIRSINSQNFRSPQCV